MDEVRAPSGKVEPGKTHEKCKRENEVIREGKKWDTEWDGETYKDIHIQVPKDKGRCTYHSLQD